MIDLKKLLNELVIPYKKIELYQTALTHSSYGNENNVENNERLEFLGDAVIELLMSDYLYTNSDLPEGTMTKKRAQAVREEALVIYSNKIDLKSYLLLGRGEEIKGANDAMIADSLEALFAATYLDLGLNEAKRLFDRIIVPSLEESFNIRDFKSILQEIIHGGGKRNISYQIIKESGPSHDKEFEAVVILDKDIILGNGYGKTKKEAEQKAAEEALKKGNYDFKNTL
ncbi:MAG: ribonuclease III [Acholeplasma sp.]|nr:ribonuclease III [Acholeplasma sp.]